MPNWNVWHELHSASNNNVVGSGGDKSHSSCYSLICTDASHCNSMCRSFVAEASGQSSLTCNIWGFHFLYDGAVNNIIDEFLVDFRFSQKAPVKDASLAYERAVIVFRRTEVSVWPIHVALASNSQYQTSRMAFGLHQQEQYCDRTCLPRWISFGTQHEMLRCFCKL